MSRRFKIIFLLTVILLQTTVLAHFKPFSVIPNYMFVTIVAMSVICADTEIVVISAVTGLLTDMFTGASIGLNTLLCMYSSIGCVIVSDSMYNKRMKMLCPLCFAASFLYETLFGVFSTLMRDAVLDIKAIFSIVMPVAVVNTVIFIPVYFILKRVRYEKKRKGIKYEQQI